MAANRTVKSKTLTSPRSFNEVTNDFVTTFSKLYRKIHSNVNGLLEIVALQRFLTFKLFIKKHKNIIK